MRITREVLRQKWVLGKSHREVGLSLGLGVGTVSVVLARARGAGLDWSTAENLSEDEVEAALYGSAGTALVRELPDPSYIHTELKRPGVTRQLLHLEYLEVHPEGYRYTQFCEHYRRWRKAHRLSMRQIHRGGEKMFPDYAGMKPHHVDPGTGEEIEAELFVAVLGASNYTFAEATATQTSLDWIASHVRAFGYFGGVPGAVVPDQLKTGVTRPCFYEPGLQRTYQEMAGHYGTVILPARPRHPKDKAKVEVGVQIAERWILARLRNQTFFSLRELNARIGELLEELNARRMRLYGASRREQFERVDKPELKSLPVEPFEYAEWKRAKVNIDYHIEVAHHAYSVPYPLLHETVEARLTSGTVEIYHKGSRVAAHARGWARGGMTTVAEHMPKAHQKHLEWTPTRMISWAGSIGIETRTLVEAILSDRPHPEQGYRSCLGILRLSKGYGHERLEAACARAVKVRARSYRHVAAILKAGLERMPLEGQGEEKVHLGAHEHIRGSDYYTNS